MMMDVITARAVRLAEIHSLEANADSSPPKSPALEMTALSLAFARAYEIARVARGDVNREGAWWSEVLIRRHRRQLTERMQRILDAQVAGELTPGPASDE